MPLIRIPGQFRAGSPKSPNITAVVTLPRLAAVRLMEFLIDTGCDVTTLHPLDTRQMGLNFSHDFAGIPMGSTYGIGGSNGYWEEVAEIQFLHSDIKTWDTITLPVHIAEPSAVNSAFPSLLGRDILQHYRFISDAKTDEVILERTA
jgi:hypothetical protein